MGNGAVSNMEDCRELCERTYFIDGLVLNRYFVDARVVGRRNWEKKYKNTFKIIF